MSYLVTLLPRPADRQEEEQFAKLFHQWRIEKELSLDIPPLENIRFESNPEWRNEVVFSIQAAHNARGPWSLIWVLYFAAQGAFLGIATNSGSMIIVSVAIGMLIGLSEVGLKWADAEEHPPKI